MKMMMNKQKIRILALICFLGLQPMPVRAYSRDFMAPVIAYLVENKAFSAVMAVFALCITGFVGYKMYIGRMADRVEELLRFNEIRPTGSTGVYGPELMIRQEKMGRLFSTASKNFYISVTEAGKQEALNLFAIPDVRQELFDRQESALEQELERSDVWQLNIYANCGQKLMEEKQTEFQVSCAIGTEHNIDDKREIKDRLTSDQRRYAGLKVACLDLIGKNNLPVWLKNTTRFKTHLEQISKES